MQFLINHMHYNVFIMLSIVLLCLSSFRVLHHIITALLKVSDKKKYLTQAQTMLTLTAFNLLLSVVLLLAINSVDSLTSRLVLGIVFAQFVYFNCSIFRRELRAEMSEI